MSNHPTPYDPWEAVPEPPTVGDEYDGNPVIVRAVKSIYVFAPGLERTITREQAEAILRWWQHYSELSEREVAAILRRFPEHMPPTQIGDGVYRAELGDGNSGPGGPMPRHLETGEGWQLGNRNGEE